MGSFTYDKEKAKSATLYIINCLQESNIEASFHKIFKILYLAEKDHLSKFARPIVGDNYHAMDYGPVPSRIYDDFKEAKNTNNDCVEIHGRNVIALETPDLDELSESEIECLNNSIVENMKLSFGQLVDKSHDDAYHNAPVNGVMSFRDIAKTSGANEDMLNYLAELEENCSIFQ